MGRSALGSGQDVPMDIDLQEDGQPSLLPASQAMHVDAPTDVPHSGPFCVNLGPTSLSPWKVPAPFPQQLPMVFFLAGLAARRPIWPP